MKLAEALLDRVELQKKIADLIERIENNAIVQQDDKPLENPNTLFSQLCSYYLDLDTLTQRINTTNNTTPFDDKLKMCDSLAVRDSLDKQIKEYGSLSQSFNIRTNRMTKTEIKYITTMDPSIIRNHAEQLKVRRKELDRKIQKLNWETELQ